MGMHEIKDAVDVGNLVEVLTPGLEDRARYHKPLGTRR